MGLLLFILILALVFGGLSFVVHSLFWVAVALFLLWVIATFARATRRGP